MMSLHIHNHFTKKHDIGNKLLLTVCTVLLQEHVDMVAGDFNGAARRRQSGSEPRPISNIQEAFANTDLPVPPGPTPLWRPGGVPGDWSDVCGFLKPPGSESEWQVRMHGAFTIPNSTLGLKEKDQSCHHEVWVHTLHVNARLVDRATRDDRSRKLNLKKNRHTTTAREKGGLVKKRPFARGTGHPYDLQCFHEQWSNIFISTVNVKILTQ